MINIENKEIISQKNIDEMLNNLVENTESTNIERYREQMAITLEKNPEETKIMLSEIKKELKERISLPDNYFA